MTLDHAINYYDERAKEYRANVDIKQDDYMDLRNDLFEAEQLASWLNELKLLRERVEKRSESCNDCISRQGALEPYKTLDDNDTICIWLVRKNIEQQPSVNPQQYVKSKRKESIRDMQDDTISRQAVLDYIYNDLRLGDVEIGNDVERQMELESSYEYVKLLPPVNPQPKIGHWVDECSCSVCNWIHENSDGFALITDYNYCPNCGAKMVKSQESEDREW